ncbi:hypothetical protein KIP88_02460 [Bradyrhizobium sp. SRL28]|uniref:hypothetical protein n=1 Tax=Bradyrhizobium sp. SRL28 TaxID=2836178 RepID=UPI001BDE4070|nr:hypothetical protein [Bradyrhizobium sp. SRL28]MBT1509352.1 hypothetical protein [Bradyrhizobium sp. SRL28]
MIALKALIEFASTQAGKLFRRQGILYPLYHCIRADGETTILNQFDQDKDLSVAMTKAWMHLNDIDTYVFMDEAWILDTTKSGSPEPDLEWIKRHGVSKHPDRREVVMFSAENLRGERLTAKRFILRPEIGKPTLAPLVIDEPFEHSEGRMVGLLNWEKK